MLEVSSDYQMKALSGISKTILVVDDDERVCSLIADVLESDGFKTITACSEAAMLKAIRSQHIDLITLDLNLGQIDGLKLTEQVRAICEIPIIIVSGRDSPNDRVLGLERGVDDYITKPFHLKEVVLRVRSVLNRRSKVPDKQSEKITYSCEYFFLDPRKACLEAHSGDQVDLTATEYQLLEYFVLHPFIVLSRDELWQVVRGREWSPLDRTLDGHIARLRAKIEPLSGSAHRLIKSIRNVGYVFSNKVERIVTRDA